MSRRDRAYELDLLRGVAMIMMLIMHLSWDIRYEFGINSCKYLISNWFNVFVHPIILVLFLGIAGICCTFSRNNIRRGCKLLIVALGFTIGTYIATNYMGIECLILFNVLHLLSLSVFIYGLINWLERRFSIEPNKVTFITGLIGIYIAIVGSGIHDYDLQADNMLLLPVGFYMRSMPEMADYLPIFPWMGIFFVGVAIGRICYKEKKSLFPGRSEALRRIEAPIEFLGRHSLLIYITHQPLMYGILYVILKAAGKL